ncbi:MAG: hypothetical protein ACFCBW_16165 [Candidatus Competibacterales bacterium]
MTEMPSTNTAMAAECAILRGCFEQLDRAGQRQVVFDLLRDQRDTFIQLRNHLHLLANPFGRHPDETLEMVAQAWQALEEGRPTIDRHLAQALQIKLYLLTRQLKGLLASRVKDFPLPLESNQLRRPTRAKRL